MTPAHFDVLREDVRRYLDGLPELFVQDLFCGADPAHQLAVRYVSPNAWHMAFVRNMFLRPDAAALASFVPNFTVLHAPEYQADPARHGTRTGTFIVLNFAERTILIGGTRYAKLRTMKDRKSTRLNSSHTVISYAVFCLKKKNIYITSTCFSYRTLSASIC